MKCVGAVCVLCGMVALSCGGMTSTAVGDAGQGGVAGHLDSAVSAKEGGPTDAEVKDAATDAGSWQKWCEPGMVNDPACPAVSPKPGQACGELGLQCAYPTGPGVALDDCTKQNASSAPWWVSTGVLCRHNCNWVADAGTVPVGGAACASRSVVACHPDAYQTKQMLLDSQIEGLAQSCGVSDVHDIWVAFSGGCATSIAFADGAVGTCMAKKLATQRYECAADMNCAEGMFAPP